MQLEAKDHSQLQVVQALPAIKKTVNNLQPLDESQLEVKPALIRIQDGRVLSATVYVSEREVQWNGQGQLLPWVWQVIKIQSS